MLLANTLTVPSRLPLVGKCNCPDHSMVFMHIAAGVGWHLCNPPVYSQNERLSAAADDDEVLGTTES